MVNEGVISVTGLINKDLFPCSFLTQFYQMDMAPTRRWLRLPGYQPSTSSAIYSGKSGWVFPSEFQLSCLPSSSATRIKSPSFLLVHVSPQALESKLAACRNFAKDQRARKAYALDNGNALNANYSQSLHTSYFDKAWVKPKHTCLLDEGWLMTRILWCNVTVQIFVFSPSRTEMVTFPALIFG